MYVQAICASSVKPPHPHPTWTLPTSHHPPPLAGHWIRMGVVHQGVRPASGASLGESPSVLCYFSPEEGYLMENLLEPTLTPSPLPSPPLTPPPNGYEEVANLPPLTLPPPP